MKHTSLSMLASAFSIAFTLGSATAADLDGIKAKGFFVYGLEAQYKPFEFRNEANAIVGYDIDVADEVARRIGNVTAKPMDTNWATVIQSLYNGEFDVVIGGMTATEKRYARVNFSVPYMNASSGLLVKSDSGIKSQKDLGGKTVGAGAGTPSIEMLALSAQENGISYAGAVKSMDDDAVAYEALKAGRIDAYASSAVSLLEFTKTTPGFTVLPFTSAKWKTEYTVMAFRKEDEGFRSEVNKHLLAMKADGTLEKLQVKWFSQSFVGTLPDQPPTW